MPDLLLKLFDMTSNDRTTFYYKIGMTCVSEWNCCLL